MPRFSANLGYLWPELPLAHRIHAARQAGFEAVECHAPYETDPVQVRKALADTGLPMLSLNTPGAVGDPDGMGTASIPGREAETRAGIDRALDYAGTVACRNIHVLAACAGATDDAIDTYLDNLGYACEAAAGTGIGVLIEPMNHVDRPDYTLHTVEQAIGIVERLRRRLDAEAADGIGLIVDCYHVARTEGDVPGALTRALPFTRHIQIGSVPDRAEPDHGELHYPTVFKHIDTLGYAAYVGAEYRPATNTNSGLDWYAPYRAPVDRGTRAPGVYRDMNQAELDAEYNNSGKVPRTREHLHWYIEASDAVRAGLPGELDIAYGDSPTERLDLFYPNGQVGGRGRPVHVFIHGGYWRAIDKRDFSYVARGLTHTEALSVVINYALIPTVDMDELVAQCRRSLAWLWHHVAEYGGDPAAITLSGHSAGGHLVAMMMATDWPGLDAALPANLVRAGVSISGLFDLEPIRRSFLNDSLALTEDAAGRNSPVHLAKLNAGPLVCTVGDSEGPEYHAQSDVLAECWGLAPAERLSGHDHFTIVRELHDPDSPLSQRITALLRG